MVDGFVDLAELVLFDELFDDAGVDDFAWDGVLCEVDLVFKALGVVVDDLVPVVVVAVDDDLAAVVGVAWLDFVLDVWLFDGDFTTDDWVFVPYWIGWFVFDGVIDFVSVSNCECLIPSFFKSIQTISYSPLWHALKSGVHYYY